MRHYVCVGDCVEVSSSPGVCTTEGCTHQGKVFLNCSCNDEMHDEAFEKAKHAPSLESYNDEPNPDELAQLEDELDEDDAEELDQVPM